MLSPSPDFSNRCLNFRGNLCPKEPCASHFGCYALRGIFIAEDEMDPEQMNEMKDMQKKWDLDGCHRYFTLLVYYALFRLY